MKQRLTPLVLAAAAVTLGLSACGSDSAAPASNSSLPGVDVTIGAPGGYQHPTGADEVVFSYTQFGGFTTQEFAFQQIPTLSISGDGRVFSAGAQIAIYPGPLLPAVQVQTITEAGIQQVLGAADAAGLFQEIVYDQPTDVADAATTQITMTVDGVTYVHDAYALGFSDPDGNVIESSPERQALADFVAQLGDLSALAGPDQVGETEVYEPESYGIQGIVVDDISAYGSDGIDPTVTEWPADIGVRLADAVACTMVSAADVGATLAAANQLTFFTDAGVTYQVLAKPILPGSTCE